jgi:TatD DNase family protein
MAGIIAVCVSAKKGGAKINVGSARLVADHGLENDAHAGAGHRQVSLLSGEKIEEMAKGIEYGAFGENIVTEGIDLSSLLIGDRLRAGDALLEITQIGKECHDRCAIYHQMGDCVMPRRGFLPGYSGAVL